jgi:hypothetical protein
MKPCNIYFLLLLVGLSFLALPTLSQSDLRFEQNSKQMYDKVLEESPWFIRGVVQKKVDKAIREVCEKGVTEQDMYEVVKQTTPKKFLKRSFEILDAHKTG